MLRELINLMQGRRKTVEKEIDVSEIKAALRTLDDTIKVTFHYAAGNMVISPEATLEYFDSHMPPRSNFRYVEGRHQVFSSKTDKRHYFDFTMAAPRSGGNHTIEYIQKII